MVLPGSKDGCAERYNSHHPAPILFASKPKDAGDKLAKWLVDTMCSERSALNRMLEKRHAAMQVEFLHFISRVAPNADSLQIDATCRWEEPAPQNPSRWRMPRPHPPGQGPVSSPRISSPPLSPARIGATIWDVSPKQRQLLPGTEAADNEYDDDQPESSSQDDIWDGHPLPPPRPERESKLRSGTMGTSKSEIEQAAHEVALAERRAPLFLYNGSDLYPKKYLLHFEITMAAIIVINVIIMSLERQYNSFDIGHYDIGYPNTRPSPETWPWAADFFEVAEWVIGLVFVGEALLMLAILRWRYFTSRWQLFDLVVVLSWVLSRLHGISMIINPTMLRLVKLVRLVRILRVGAMIELVDSLSLLVKSVVSSVMVLFWSLWLLLLVIVVMSLIISQCLEPWIRNGDNFLSERKEVFEQWGSFSRSLETMFEVTLGNWGPPCRLLQTKVSEWWMVVLVGYKCIVGFAVVQVITSVFIQQTFKVVARDEQVMINEKSAATEALLKNLQHLFEVIDVSNDGSLSHEELDACLQDQTVQTWFGAIGIESQEASTLFDLMDDGDGQISSCEFLEGVKALRGTAKSIDMMQLRRAIHRIERKINSMQPNV